MIFGKQSFIARPSAAAGSFEGGWVSRRIFGEHNVWGPSRKIKTISIFFRKDYSKDKLCLNHIHDSHFSFHAL
jgi:hypothetical protein